MYVHDENHWSLTWKFVHSVDMKTVIAEAANDKLARLRIETPASSSGVAGVGPPPDANFIGARRSPPSGKQNQSLDASGSPFSLRTSGKPWGYMASHSASVPDRLSTSTSTATALMNSRPKDRADCWRNPKANISSPIAQSSPPRRVSSQPGLGPIFIPSRQTPSSSSLTSTQRAL